MDILSCFRIACLYLSLFASIKAMKPKKYEFYQNAFHQIPTPTLILDGKYQIMEISDSYVDALKSTREECIDRDITELIRERLALEEAERLIETIKEAYNKRSSQMLEVVDSTKRHFWNVHVRPWTEPRTRNGFKGVIRRLSDTFRPKYTTLMLTLQSTDLSSIVEANTRMSHSAMSANIYHLLVQNLEDFAIFMLDVNGHVKTWNAGAQKLFQYTEEEIQGKHFTTFVREEDLPEFVNELRMSLNNELRHMTAWRVRKDGTTFWSAISVTPLYNNQHRHIGFVKTTQDLTARLAAERAMIEAHEQAARYKDNVLSEASHELRSPLTGLRLGVEELVSMMTPIATSEQLEVLDGIRESGKILARIVDSILDHSKFQAKAVTLSLSNIVIRDMIETLVANYRKRTQVPIHVRIGYNVPTVVLGDVMRLQQVLSNLIDNAVKYTRDGSITVIVQVRVRSFNVVPTLKNTGEENSVVPLLVKVKDSGIGLTNEEINRIFQPFSQADNTIYERYGGTGLGLSISKQCVELMNGRIWVESRKGEGSTFSFTMDLARGKREEIAERCVETQERRVSVGLPNVPAKIVVVDDNDINRKMIMQMLRREGMNPIPMSDGLEVLAYFEALSKKKYDNDHIITMDCQMPGMNGLDATRAIHALPHMHQVPIIGLTANAMHADEQSCLDAGMMSYLSKPFQKADLISQLNSAAALLASIQQQEVTEVILP